MRRLHPRPSGVRRYHFVTKDKCCRTPEVLSSEHIEAILKSMHGRHHEGKRKLGLSWKPGLRPRQPQHPQWAQSASRGPHGRFQPRVGSGGVGSHARTRRTYHVDEPDHEFEGSDLDAMDEVGTESTTAREGAYPE